VTIEAEMHDGTILEFPDGTAPEVIQRVVRSRLSQPAAPEGSGVGAWLGRRARDVMEGVASFPSAAADALVPGVAYARDAIGGQSGVGLARQGADALGLPTPQTDGERMTSAVVQGVAGAIPTMGIGAGPGLVARGVNALSQGVGGAAGGAASEATRQAGYGEAAQVGAGVLGGLAGAGAVQGAATLGRGVASAVAPFTQAGRESAVTDVMLRSADDPANLRARVDAGLAATDQRLPNSPVTPAVAARDPGLLRVESSVRAGAMGPQAQSALAEVGTRRAQAQIAEMDALGDGSTAGERGAAIRGERGRPGQAGSGLSGAQQARQQAVSRAYEAIDPNGTSRLPVAPLQAVAQEEMAGRWGAGAGEMPANVRQMLGTIEGAGDAQPWRFMQNLRGQANDILGDASASERARATARQVVGAIDQAAQDAGTTGGFTAEQAQRWRAAGELRRRLGEDFNRDTTGANATGRILADGGYGAPRLVDEAVPGAALANVSSVRQALRASGGDAQVRTALQGQFMDLLSQRATGAAEVVDGAGTPTRVTSPAGFRRFWDQNRVVARELFGPQEYRRLEMLARDFSEASIGANTGATRNSQTVQNMTVGQMIARVSGGLLDGETAFGSTVSRPIKWLYQEPERLTRELLGQAMADPRLAAMLLARASPQSVQRATAYIEQNMMGRLGQAAGGAAVRQAVRSGAEQERRQAQQSQ